MKFEEDTVDISGLPIFTPSPKIPRLRRDCVITEKIDGTNGRIFVSDDSTQVFAGSRSRWLLEGEPDNFGFRAWVEDHVDELRAGLGPGNHFGEWWGSGIQRGYGLAGEKRFSLFNVERWASPDSSRPACCNVVPILYTGPFSDAAVQDALEGLRKKGSRASLGFREPEGVVVYLPAACQLFKVTLDNDDRSKTFLAA